MLSHPEPPPFQLKVMSNIAGSVRDWPFSIPWVSFCWPLILVTHLLLSCTLKKLIIRQHASFSHCLANKLQAAIREVCAKQCVAESCRFFKLAGWVTKWISITDSNLARGLTPSLGDSEVTHFFPLATAVTWGLCQTTPGGPSCRVPCCQLPLRCEYQGHPRTKKSPSWYKMIQVLQMGPRRVQTLIFLSALLCSLAGQMESAHRIVNWDQYLKCKIAKSIKPWTSNRFDILWPKCSQISAIAAARDTSLISTSYRLPFPNESTKHIWSSSKLSKLHWGHVKKVCGTLV